MADTAATYTILSEHIFPKNRIRELGVRSTGVQTLVGTLPSYFVPGCNLVLFDHFDTQNYLPLNKLTMQFVKEQELTRKQQKVFRQVFLDETFESIQPPHNLLGQDVLNQYLFLADKSKPNVLLTDEAAPFQPVISGILGARTRQSSP